jgi:1,4-dihydroxy-2-naphthoate octaprenyltransferase
MRAVRAPSLSATATPCIATLLLGLEVGWGVNVLGAVFSVLGVLAVQIGVNLLNDLADARRGVDIAGTLGGSGVLQEGLISRETLSRTAYLAFGFGLLCGLPSLLAHPELWVVLGIAALGSWGYSDGPGLKYRALGDLAVLLLCGPVLTVGFSIAAFGRFDGLVIALGAALGLAAVGILHVNNFQDIENDTRVGAYTVARFLGVRGSRVYLIGVYLGALVIWPVAAFLAGLGPVLAFVPLFGIIPAVHLVRRLLRASAGSAHGLLRDDLRLVRFDAAKLHLLIGASMILGLAIG